MSGIGAPRRGNSPANCQFYYSRPVAITEENVHEQ